MPAKWSDVKRVRGIKLSLTWFDARKCWKKKLAGKVSYFQHPNSEAGYTLALLELAVLTGADVRTKAIENRQNLIGVSDTIQAEKLLEEIKDIHDGAEVVTGGRLGLNVNPLRNVSQGGRLVWRDRLATSRQPKTGPTIGVEVDAFLNRKKAQAKAGQRSFNTLRLLRKDLKLFESWAKATTSINDINSKMCGRFQLWLIESEQFGKKRLSTKTTGGPRRTNIYKSFVQFVRWLARNHEEYHPPKNLNDPDFGFSKSKKPSASKLFTTEDVATLREILKPWLVKSLLLALNCSFTQADISVLTWGQLKNGRLIHKRHKTQRDEWVPVVNYKLWQATIDALGERGAEDELIVRTPKGSQVVVEKLIEKMGVEEVSIWDNLGNTWFRLMRDKKIVQKPFGYFRKTGATIVKEFDRGIETLYTGHAEQGTDKHYALFVDGATYKPLDDATDAICERLDIKPLNPGHSKNPLED